MQKTNLLYLTVVFGVLLTLSSAVSYGNPRRVDELKIPFCLDQFEYTCLACGYDSEKKTFTAPNKLKTACLPTKDGCAGFSDMKGEVCDTTLDCTCGYSKTKDNKCVKATIDNCKKINYDGTCEQCISTKESGSIGGGLFSYALSFDKTKCIDSSKLTPNCLRFQSDDITCAVCNTNYIMTPTFKCVYAIPASYTNCLMVDETADNCIMCAAGQKIGADTQKCTSNISNVPTIDKCAQYAQLPNGENDMRLCVACPKGYFNTLVGCQNLYDDEGVRMAIDIITGAKGNNDNFFNKGCIAYTTYLDIQSRTYFKCLVHATTENLALYPWNTGFNKAMTVGAAYTEKCRDFDYTTYTCKSADACEFATSVYNEELKTCDVPTFDCTVNCKIAENRATCKTAHAGYVVVGGRARKISHIDGCQTLNADGVTCDKCLGLHLNQASASGNYKDAWKYYLRDPIDQDCDLKGVQWCATYNEENGRCATCRPGFTIDIINDICNPEAFATAPKSIPGCQVWDGKACTTAFEGFYCTTNLGYTVCYQNRSDCFKMDATVYNSCEICFFGFIRTWDTTDRVFKCDTAAVGDVPLNKYCKTTLDGCTCSVCQDTLTETPVLGKCSAWVGGTDEVAGCVKHKQFGQCSECAPSFLLADDGKCYDLLATYDNYFTSANQYLEPCTAATTFSVCKTCDKTYFDVGFVKIEASVDKTAASKDGRNFEFCIYNEDTDQATQANDALDFTLSAGSKTFNRIRGCDAYEINKNENVGCLTPQSGWTNALSSDGNKKLIHATESDGSASNRNCAFGKVVLDGTTYQCTECQKGYFYHALTKTCKAITTECMAFTADDITQCLTPRPGCFIHEGTAYQHYQIDGTACHTNTWACAIQKNSYITATSSFEIVDCYTTVASQKQETISRCHPTSSYITNCMTFNTVGVCSACDTGYVLTVAGGVTRPTRLNIKETYCHKEIKYCSAYTVDGKCATCVANEEGVPTFQDTVGNVCFSSKNQIASCDTYKFGDVTTCIQCTNGGALPDCKIVGQENCTAYNTVTERCDTCAMGFKLNYKGQCIKWYKASDTLCTTPFNSTTCYACNPSTATKIKASENEDSEVIGHCVSRQIDGCLLSNSENSKCYRCDSSYVLYNGLCIAIGTGTTDFNIINRCGEIEFNADTKEYVCQECRRGWAIDGNRTICVSNQNACSDITGGNDCAVLEELKPFGTAFKCKDYGRSNSVLLYFSAIAAFVLYFII